MSNPLKADIPALNKATATLEQLRFTAQVPSDATLDAVPGRCEPPASSPVSTSVGGDAYKAPPTRATCPSSWACSSRS